MIKPGYSQRWKLNCWQDRSLGTLDDPWWQLTLARFGGLDFRIVRTALYGLAQLTNFLPMIACCNSLHCNVLGNFEKSWIFTCILSAGNQAAKFVRNVWHIPHICFNGKLAHQPWSFQEALYKSRAGGGSLPTLLLGAMRTRIHFFIRSWYQMHGMTETRCFWGIQHNALLRHGAEQAAPPIAAWPHGYWQSITTWVSRMFLHQ